MPCVDGREHLEEAVAMALACAYCRLLERKGVAIPDWAKPWWEKHKREDKLREAAEKFAKDAGEYL